MYFKRWFDRRKRREAREAKRRERLAKWRETNKTFFENWDAMVAQRHAVVHIPSLGVEVRMICVVYVCFELDSVCFFIHKVFCHQNSASGRAVNRS